MKQFILLIIITFFIIGCNKDQLEVINSNNPTFEALNTEAGLTALATGVYLNGVDGDDDPFIDYDFTWRVQAFHESMADAIYISAGNFSFRWANQPTSITLDDGTVVTPPQEGPQPEALRVRNVRTQIDGNAFAHEWMTMYKSNNLANHILNLVDDVEISTNPDLKKKALKAWAYFWKGYAYSRIGSMYTSGLIVSTPDVTNTDYVPRERMIEEATLNFDAAIEQINQIDGNISGFMSSVIPDAFAASSFRGNAPSAILTKEMWIRNINTLKARNILVNKKIDEMTMTDWDEIQSLTDNGLLPGDFIFVVKQDGVNFNVNTNVPLRLLVGWHFLSERLVQDFKPGDQRFLDNVFELENSFVNDRGRGIQYGTRWGFRDAEYASLENNRINIYYAGTYDENELMKAEANIYKGQIETGLSIIDNVREHQNANLSPISGTGLTEDQALEELRRERRIGLLLRGVGFYDARRWGVTEPVSQGGGRTGLVVLDDLGNLNTNATFDYNYLDYWDVPDQEAAFGSPLGNGSETSFGDANQ
ncbi:RagB/SusD family nutrient uptake outer membrane protein [Aquimarina gracilis]|uniref:RagB/SusD family nutrient uptake outer membrane protein n=1 Tax=Aquimarina gracilis TaxID=874422 RepID=A0ABU5ZQT0_9FLAO|nr:RagB/SusD family nutrient uptake outer membrane protein [Aquimarina gracilis]MEB3344413.1 RagB/SusD family nutrient uptake outer membrane protein [Aquimarina gracilis]